MCKTERVAFTLLDYYEFLCIDFSVDDSLCKYSCGERKKRVEREGKGFFGSSVYAFWDLAFLLFPLFSQNFLLFFKININILYIPQLILQIKI